MGDNNSKTKQHKKFFGGWPYQLGSLEDFLECQARNGLYFAGTEGPRYIFLKGKATSRRYQVNVINRNQDDADSIKASFVSSGWKYLGQKNRFQFFYTDDSQVDKIELDNANTLKQVCRMTIPYMAIFIGIMLMIALFMFFLPLSHIAQGNIYNLTAVRAASMVFALAINICALSELIKFVKFYFDNNTRVKNSQWIIYPKYIEEKRGRLLYGGIILVSVFISAIFIAAETFALSLKILIVFIILITGLYFFLRFTNNPILARIQSNEKAKAALIMLTCLFVSGIVLISVLVVAGRLLVNAVDKKDSIPYSLADMGYDTSTEANRYVVDNQEITRNFLYTKKEYVEVLYDKDVNATIAYVDYEINKFYTKKMCSNWVERLLNKQQKSMLVQEKAIQWDAQEVYHITNYNNTGEDAFLIKYENKVYILDDNMKDVTAIKEALASE